jgi:WhiB family transcriptional regulator, redox-sensing transcriptional regulator
VSRRMWRADALCAQTDPEAFFPDKGESPAAAKAVCRACPVTAECLAWALEHDERFGVWGGLSERERRLLRRGRRVPTSRAPLLAPAVEVGPDQRGGQDGGEAA